MTDATVTTATISDGIDAREAAHFGKLAADWWNPAGSSAMLHRLNPPRLAYLRERVDAHWDGDSASFTPLKGKRALDMGCGAGLLSEPLARLGAQVTAVDAAPENIGAARAHASAVGLAIDYRVGTTDAVAGETFDLIVSFEVIEHVPDPAAFVSALAGNLATGGLLLLSTPNRTPLSKLAMITIAEGIGQIPKGTHDWEKFLTPEDLGGLLSRAGLRVVDTRGLSFSPAAGFHLSDNVALDYFIAAVAA
ncbi:bifunctional 2-polyprenyl-6-hydroxyphenol methylase/3-demethylubiquinol 3-O-methyltransferase UbiG [Roseomonas aeriglobus]|nr:bifunctional 2-polyprenyl-6-hydroxyphenol methylase/3-demethylubiquinol 3-O-methyltransferase UbiG [Roseomonas aeriglobus]